MLWCEDFRPKTIMDCILPDRLKTVFLQYIQDNQIPNLILTGTAGVGKTTVAKALCEEIGCDYLFINGSDENGVDTVRVKIKGYASSMSLSGGRKVIIIDEADYLSPQAQAAFRSAIEEFESNCSFIFTCNYINRLIEPLHSRCAIIEFSLLNDEKAQIAKQFFKRIIGILDTIGISYDKKVIAELLKKYFPDFRRTINELQRYSKFGQIDTGILAQIISSNIEDLILKIKNKDFTSIRKWVGTNDLDANSLFRQIYDALYDIMEPQSIPQAVIILADYQYKQAFVADSEINIVACLTELMINCEYK